MRRSRAKDPQTDRAITQIEEFVVPKEIHTDSPRDIEGNIGEMKFYDDGDYKHLYIKLPDGWYELGTNLNKINPAQVDRIVADEMRLEGNIVIHNTTEQDTDGGRAGTISFWGEQSGGEITTLAKIQASHDATSDDEKGDLIFYTNDGSDINTPTERARIDSSGFVGIGTTNPTNPLNIVGANGCLLNLEPSSDDTQKGLCITPTATVDTTEAEWDGVIIDGAALDPTVVEVEVHGLDIDFSGVALTNNPQIDGLDIEMPAQTDGQHIDAIHITEGEIHQEYTAGTAAAAVYHPLHIIVDASSQDANSETHAMDVSLRSTLSGAVVALGVESNVDVLHQHTGVAFTPDQDGSDSYAGRYVAIGTDYTAGIDGNEILIANSDEIWIGDAATFDRLEVIMTTHATKTVVPEFYYYNTSSAWVQFFPSDNTDGFTEDGLIVWNPDGFTNWDATGDPAGGEGAAGYWMKIKRTRIADPGSPTPTTIKIDSTTEYHWDKNGNIQSNSLSVVDGIVAPSAILGYAIIFVDTADGDLKVIFGDGTTKTLATD